jgi:chemotaxis protein MotB
MRADGSAAWGTESVARTRNQGPTIVIRREEGGEAGHHGGAWKVAYADFVTAMMAFFLLMWLLNATTEQQRKGIADYFAPSNLMSQSTSGNGQPFGGSTPHSPAQLSTDTSSPRIETGPRPVLQDIEVEDETETPAQPVATREASPGPDDAPDARPGQAAIAVPAPGDGGSGAARRDADLATASEAALRRELEKRERDALEQLAGQLRAAVAGDPALAELAQQFRVEQVPEGLRIQLLDSEGRPMFTSGGNTLNERSRALVAKVASVIRRVPNAVSITGHTDATPFRNDARSNWDLSAERANATRRLLVENGVGENRLRSVAGLAEREPLLPDAPEAAANRRVSILLLRQAPQPPAIGVTPR